MVHLHCPGCLQLAAPQKGEEACEPTEGETLAEPAQRPNKSDPSERPNKRETSACPKCEELHARHVQRLARKHGCKGRKHEAGIAEQVNGLMKACYLAVEEGRYTKAIELARQAHALDPMRVEGDPIIYKMQLSMPREIEAPAEPGTCPGNRPSNNYPDHPIDGGLSLRPELPAINPDVVTGLDDVLVRCEAETSGSVHGQKVVTRLFEQFQVPAGFAGTWLFNAHECKFAISLPESPFGLILSREPELGDNHLSVGMSLVGGLSVSCRIPSGSGDYLFTYGGRYPLTLLKHVQAK